MAHIDREPQDMLFRFQRLDVHAGLQDEMRRDAVQLARKPHAFQAQDQPLRGSQWYHLIPLRKSDGNM